MQCTALKSSTGRSPESASLRDETSIAQPHLPRHLEVRAEKCFAGQEKLVCGTRCTEALAGSASDLGRPTKNTIRSLAYISHAKRVQKERKTYNSRDSLLVTHATTNRSQGSLSMEERTGFRVFYLLWSYVGKSVKEFLYE
ncbi:hypothetical protein IWX90DRAFT_192386 [Phyllosticta citrichinensis]|uniref:Uncharacterized protein n=1 Tax=Phyllosticta citrichinensis TaxID=1130410 RepID=A0ABR1XWZ4_9PEZI